MVQLSCLHVSENPETLVINICSFWDISTKIVHMYSNSNISLPFNSSKLKLELLLVFSMIQPICVFHLQIQCDKSAHCICILKTHIGYTYFCYFYLPPAP